MSLTSYRAAPPRVNFRHPAVLLLEAGVGLGRLRQGRCEESVGCGFRGLFRSGGDLLSRVLGRSTIGAAALNGRVRDGIGCFARARTTRPGKRTGVAGPYGHAARTGDTRRRSRDGLSVSN